jgi:hypothetical protein
MYYARISVNIFFVLFTLVILRENTFNPTDHRASPDAFTVFEVAPYHNFDAITSFLDTTVLTNGRVCTTCNSTGGIMSKTALRDRARTDFGCAAGGFNPGVCEMCVDLWSFRLFDLAQLTTGVIDKTSATWKDMRADYESCFFKYSTYSVAQYVGGTNPQLHLFIWCGLMLVYSILVKGDTETNTGKGGWFQWSTIGALVTAAGIFTVVLIWVFSTTTDPNDLLPNSSIAVYDFATTNTYQIVLLLLYVVFFAFAPNSRASIDNLDGKITVFTNNNILFDIMLIAATPSMASIVCAYRGWLDYSMMTYLSQTITAVMSLVLANDVMGVFWEDAHNKQHEELEIMHGQTHLVITMVSLLSVLFVWLTDFINPRASDPFFGEAHTWIYLIFILAIVISPMIFQTFGAKDPRAALHFKEGIEFSYRVIVFALIAKIFFIGNDA